jgi:hypothetical protein
MKALSHFIKSKRKTRATLTFGSCGWFSLSQICLVYSSTLHYTCLCQHSTVFIVQSLLVLSTVISVICNSITTLDFPNKFFHNHMLLKSSTSDHTFVLSREKVTFKGNKTYHIIKEYKIRKIKDVARCKCKSK